MNETEPMVTYTGFLDIQVCVPKSWSDAEVTKFAETKNPCGTTNGWFIRRQGHKLLGGGDERTSCEERESCVHIMLDA